MANNTAKNMPVNFELLAFLIMDEYTEDEREDLLNELEGKYTGNIPAIDEWFLATKLIRSKNKTALRQQALLKLTPEEIEALDIKADE